MGRVVSVLWLVVVLALVVLLGQSLNYYDLPLLRELRALLPPDQTVAGVQLTPVPTPLAAGTRALPRATSAPARTDPCTPTAPRFVFGAATLKTLVGAAMGEPLECERVVDAAGNIEQKTTTGLAYYRARTNVAAFTNGADHWAVTSAGLVHWTSDAVEPPPEAELVR